MYSIVFLLLLLGARYFFLELRLFPSLT
jgi:hypothetical protein